jgi:hypothetical protein
MCCVWLEQASRFIWKLHGEVPTHVDPFFVLDVCFEEINANVTHMCMLLKIVSYFRTYA